MARTDAWRLGRPKYVKVYGVQRSGTNWIKYVLEQNFKRVTEINLPLGDKHYAPDPVSSYQTWIGESASTGDYDTKEIERALERRQLRIAVVVKPLLPWLVSFHTYRSFKAGHEIELTREKTLEWTKIWIERNRRYYEVVPRLGFPYTFVGYEHLLRKPETELPRISKELGLRLTAKEEWRLGLDRRMRRSKDSEHGESVLTNKAFSSAFYLEKQYLSLLPESSIKLAERELKTSQLEGDYPLMVSGNEGADRGWAC